MPRTGAHHSSSSTSTQMASPFSHPSSALIATPEPRNSSVLWSPSCHKESLPEETQQDEVFNVWTVNYRNLDQDARVTIKYPDPKRRVVFIGEPELAKEEHAIVEVLTSDVQSPYSMCSSATCSTTLSSTTGKPLHEGLSPPRSSHPGHTRSRDQPYTHIASESTVPQLKPSSPAPHETMGPPPYTDTIDDRIAKRVTPPVTTIAPARSTRTSIQHHKPKSKTFSRPSIALELAGYKPECGPSPLLADQATAQHVYRGIKQHISDQLKSHTDTNDQLDCARATERQQTRTCVKLAALNAEAAQDFKVAEQALGIGPGKGSRGLIRKPMYDNSAWQASPNGHAQRSPLLTGDQPNDVVEAVRRRQGRRIYASSIESVCGSNPRSHMQIREPPLLLSRTPTPPGSGGAPGSSSSSSSGDSAVTVVEWEDITHAHGARKSRY